MYRQKLLVLLLHFGPRGLRCVWSPSLGFTARLFTRLKKGREQPQQLRGGGGA